MLLLDDILQRVNESFEIADRPHAIALLSHASIENGAIAEPRLLRCALAASNGSLDLLKYYVEMLKVDWRGVIVAGEYDSANNRLQNFNLPFQERST